MDELEFDLAVQLADQGIEPIDISNVPINQDQLAIDLGTYDGADAYNPIPMPEPNGIDNSAEIYGKYGSDLTDELNSPTIPITKEELAKLGKPETYPQSKVGDPPANPPGGDSGKTASEYIKQLTNSIGEKGVAALVQGGFGMLSGASQSKMLEKKWDREKSMRDEEWARKDSHAGAGKQVQMTWQTNKKGLLGNAIK